MPHHEAMKYESACLPAGNEAENQYVTITLYRSYLFDKEITLVYRR